MRSRTAAAMSRCPNKPAEPIEGQRGKAGLRDGRDIRLCGSARAVGDRDELRPAGLHMRQHDGEPGHIGLNTSFSEVGHRRDDIAIGNPRDGEPCALEVAVIDHVGHAGPGRIVQLARLRANERDQVRNRPDVQRGAYDETQNRVGNPGDRRELARIVGQLVVLVRMRRERRCRRIEQRVVIAGADEGVDGDDGVTAGTIFHDHRLAPARRQPICEEPCADIRPAAGPERHDEFDRSRRPGLRGRTPDACQRRGE